MGESPTAIPNRLNRGERFDIVVLAAPELSKLAEKVMLTQTHKALW